MILFHGSHHSFNGPPQTGMPSESSTSEDAFNRIGVHFTTDFEMAKSFAKGMWRGWWSSGVSKKGRGYVYECEVDISYPLKTHEDEVRGWLEDLKENIEENEGYTLTPDQLVQEFLGTDDMTPYDSIIYENPVEGGEAVIVWNNRAIRLVKKHVIDYAVESRPSFLSLFEEIWEPHENWGNGGVHEFEYAKNKPTIRMG